MSEIPFYKVARTLKTRKGRQRKGWWLIEGVRLLSEAISSGLYVEIVYGCEPLMTQEALELWQTIQASGRKTAQLDENSFLALCDAETPQGLVGVLHQPKWDHEGLWAGQGDVVVLDQVRDPGNVGTILRTAEAAGVRAVWSTSGSVEWGSPKLVRSSMGASFRLPTWDIDDPTLWSDKAHAAGLSLVIADGKAELSLSELECTTPVAWIMGSEAHGVSQDWYPLADQRVRLPLNPPVESLNVGVAVGIMLFWRRLQETP